MTAALVTLLRSRRLAVVLLIAAAVLAASGTILAPAKADPHPSLHPWLLAAARFLGVVDTSRSPVFLSLVAVIALSVAFCTWQRAFPLRCTSSGRGALRLPLDLALHLSLLAIVAGGAAKGLWGTVRTQNVHVGGATGTFFDFTSGRDEPLGFTVTVLEREDSWYPLRARIGVSDAAGAKIALVEVVEGLTAVVPAAGISLRLELADPAARLLRLAVSGRSSGGTVELETAGGSKGSADFGPHRLTLVAWRRDLKGVRSRIACSGAGLPRSVGWISPRERVTCGGVGFAMTAWGEDAGGRPYVGIQAVRDPAAPVFWGGCLAFTVSLSLYLPLRLRESRGPA